jgi:hypothetical protein
VFLSHVECDQRMDVSPSGAASMTDQVLAEALRIAPLANLNGKAQSPEALALVRHVAERYPRLPSKKASSTRPYAQVKTREGYDAAVAAFLADLLSVRGSKRGTGWVRVSLKKDDYKGRPVTFRQFDNVREAWTAADLIQTKSGYPRALAFGNPGPNRGMMTRFRATDALLAICAEHGILPANIHEHFCVEYTMPGELVQLTSPAAETPTTDLIERLRSEVAELNQFMKSFQLQPPAIEHLGWVRKFHMSDRKGFEFNKGGRLYSQPPTDRNYQSVDRQMRLAMTIGGEPVAEIDIGASYLSIFYALRGKQIDTDRDAYRDILGPTDFDREITKKFISASFGSRHLITLWSANVKAEFEKAMRKKDLAPFAIDPKRYPIKLVRQKVLERHPLLERWGSEINGRVLDWADLMFIESQIIISTMLVLKRDHGIPSLPVHDSLIVPRSKVWRAQEVLTGQFQEMTGCIPSLKVVPQNTLDKATMAEALRL